MHIQTLLLVDQIFIGERKKNRWRSLSFFRCWVFPSVPEIRCQSLKSSEILHVFAPDFLGTELPFTIYVGSANFGPVAKLHGDRKTELVRKSKHLRQNKQMLTSARFIIICYFSYPLIQSWWAFLSVTYTDQVYDRRPSNARDNTAVLCDKTDSGVAKSGCRGDMRSEVWRGVFSSYQEKNLRRGGAQLFS